MNCIKETCFPVSDFFLEYLLENEFVHWVGTARNCLEPKKKNLFLIFLSSEKCNFLQLAMVMIMALTLDYENVNIVLERLQ